ncbi:MAG TPA: hypothetical protein VGV93_04675 [Acidimicrobiales bacterium]|nr:hypothetical protein [Acidimicrobiales bacterium]
MKPPIFANRQSAVVYLAGMAAWWLLWLIAGILNLAGHEGASTAALLVGAPACVAAVLAVSRDWEPARAQGGLSFAMRRRIDIPGQIREAVALSGWPRRTAFSAFGVLAVFDAVLLFLIIDG